MSCQGAPSDALVVDPAWGRPEPETSGPRSRPIAADVVACKVRPATASW